ncbi:phosphoglucosamine mutase [Methanolinea mesophila]|uniref:phosphopentomutase/phosphoglucosamine mutase n=1 Tax=Methanolinea mesophila TaxID=547055 RepID=UPI001AEB75D3|nr:phosphopentomutase/phosphoglucosamine mutase [Methanolinea mesophila]MBP1928641.1 phosphoglucosamine mutase [Methanolinea mesophila]
MLFGSSGIRRRYDGDLVTLALRVGRVLGEGGAAVALGRDTRATGPLLANALVSGILAAGGTVHSCGIVPTPAVAFCARDLDTGCMVTASHNPEQDNGIKLFNPDGSSFSTDRQDLLEQKLTGESYAGWKEQGRLLPRDARTPYSRAVIAGRHVPDGQKMVLDCGNGAGCTVSPALLSALGVRAECVNCNPQGRFGRPSEPLEEHLLHIPPLVRNSGAAGAVVHDGDADRMMAFDARGRYITGDRMLILFARYLDAKRVVTTVDASMAVEEVAEVRRTPVGDSYVSRELRSFGDFGGEPSGAWIFPRHSLCPDGPYAAALFCEMAGEWDIAAELDDIPGYPMIRESVRVERPREVLSLMGATNPTDGIRVQGEDGWFLVRASGTEQKVRITAEGKTMERAKFYMEKGRALLREGKLHLGGRKE